MSTFCMRSMAFSVSSDISVPKPMLAAWNMMIDSAMAQTYPVSLISKTDQFLSIVYRRSQQHDIV